MDSPLRVTETTRFFAMLLHFLCAIWTGKRRDLMLADVANVLGDN